MIVQGRVMFCFALFWMPLLLDRNVQIKKTQMFIFITGDRTWGRSHETSPVRRVASGGEL